MTSRKPTRQEADRLSGITASSETPFSKDSPGYAFKLPDILKHYGLNRKKQLADILNMDQSNMTQWDKREIPLEWMFAIQHHSGGALHVTMEELSRRYNTYHIEDKQFYS